MTRLLIVKVPDALLSQVDNRVSVEARKAPEMTRSAWVRRELYRALRRLAAVRA